MAISLARSNVADLFAPDTIATLQGGRYLIDSELCSSDHRTLLWGRQREIDRWLVIERIEGVDAEQAAAAMQKAPVLLALSNDNLAQCIDVFIEQGNLYTVMVTGAGVTMAQINTFAPQKAIEYGVQICNGLNYLHHHAAEITCGAVSPDAVFLTTHERVRLTHMSELLGVGNVDSAFAPTACDETCAEVFSVGATLHHALTGWQGMYRDGAPALTTLRPECGTDLEKVISRALELDPAQRYQNSVDLRIALLHLMK